ncbi:hypothetical protein CCACVL1_09178 [Corchorus capsularis]|uniref:Uncharacterized protein n=1 Tax=Corchorus capsularis TaxID=210143 RepID=A0A1R3IXE9_COCAP|nr:hypothetical protein CCACVL1_09178 [Corchorus capsularis]
MNSPMHDPLIRQPIKRLETKFERTIISLIVYSLILVLTNVWGRKGEELLQDYENRAVIMHRMDGICRVSITFGALFVIKDIFRPANRLKGSAHKHFKVWLNISLSIITGIVLILATGIVFAEGKVGIWARISLGFLVISGLVVFRQLKHLAQFIDYVWMVDLFDVGDVVMIDYVDYEILDIRLVTCGEGWMRYFEQQNGISHGVNSHNKDNVKGIGSHPNVYLLDTPGILPPSIHDAEFCCSKLAIKGAIRDSLVGQKELAQYFLAILNLSYQYKQ